MIEGIDAFNDLGKQRLDRAKARRALGALLGDAKHLGFCLVEQLACLPALRIKGCLGNLVSHGDEFAQHGTLAHDLGIAPDIGS